MTTEHLRPLLDDVRKMRFLSCLASNLAVEEVPEVAVQMVRVGRLTALAKPDGGDCPQIGVQNRCSTVERSSGGRNSTASNYSVNKGRHGMHRPRVAVIDRSSSRGSSDVDWWD